MFSRELQIMMLQNRIAKLERSFENTKLVAKAKRKLRKLEAEK